jgi:hypothetical protein
MTKPKGVPRVYPSKKTPELVADVLERIAKAEPLAAICRDINIHPTAWYDWCDADPDGLAIAYGRARATGFDVIADNTRSIARGDTKAGSSSDTQRDKLIIDTDLKLLAKWDPKRYADKYLTEHSGKDGGPIEINNTGAVSQLAALLRGAKRKDAPE